MCPWIDVKNLKHFRNLNSYSLNYFYVYLYICYSKNQQYTQKYKTSPKGIELTL